MRKMIYNTCGCNNIVPEPFESEIENIPQCECQCETTKRVSRDDFCSLKNKIIGEFLDVIKKLECGIQPDLELILQEISLIYIHNE